MRKGGQLFDWLSVQRLRSIDCAHNYPQPDSCVSNSEKGRGGSQGERAWQSGPGDGGAGMQARGGGSRGMVRERLEEQAIRTRLESATHAGTRTQTREEQL